MQRRGFLLGASALVGSALAAPAIVRAASIMRVASLRETVYGIDLGVDGTTSIVLLSKNGLLTLEQITREAIALWLQSNEFVNHYDAIWMPP